VLLRNDIEGRNALKKIVLDFYESREIFVRNFLNSEDKEWGWFDAHFLIDRKFVFKYGIGMDRGTWLGGISLAIGPHYFSPSDFWSYEDSKKFKVEPDKEAIEHNLRMLNKFLGLEA